jgi:hypothetical protein
MLVGVGTVFVTTARGFVNPRSMVIAFSPGERHRI